MNIHISSVWVVVVVIFWMIAGIAGVIFRVWWLRRIHAQMELLQKRIQRFRQAPGDELLNPPRMSSGMKFTMRGGHHDDYPAEPEADGVFGDAPGFYESHRLHGR